MLQHVSLQERCKKKQAALQKYMLCKTRDDQIVTAHAYLQHALNCRTGTSKTQIKKRDCNVTVYTPGEKMQERIACTSKRYLIMYTLEMIKLRLRIYIFDLSDMYF